MEVKALLAQLGVPENGEIEVWEVPGDDTPHGYGGWYMCVGQILQSPAEESREFSLGGWQMSFTAQPSYAVDEFEGFDVFEAHFFTWAGNYIAGDPNAV